MQFGKDVPLRLLVVDDSVEDAEAIVNGLRNRGIAVRPGRPEDVDALQDLLGNQSWDVILAAHDARTVPLDTLMQHVDASGKDLPVVVLHDDVDSARLVANAASGARGFGLRGQPEHLHDCLVREWTDLRARRALRKLEAHVRETDRRCDALIESSRDPIAYIHEGMHIRANAAYLEMFGFEDFDEIEGMSLLDMVASQDVDAFRALLKALSKGEAPPERYKLTAQNLDGDTFPAVMEFTAATYEGEACQQVVLRKQDLNAGMSDEERRHLLETDQATGLLNRQTFLKRLEDSVADVAEHAGQQVLLLIEPDHYNRMLQDIGLDASDELLAACAERLRASLAEGDIVARFSDHQFAVLRRGSDHAASMALAESLLKAFADAVLTAGQRSLNATVTIGGVQIGQKIANVSSILGKANQGLQSAMGVGGNRVELFDPGAADRAELERVQAWVDRIRDAIDNDRFLMHYQPLVSLHGEPLEMYEAYLRLLNENGELVQPMTFLQIAEEHGLLWEIDRWVVGRAIAVIAERAKAGHDTTVLVKITEMSLQDDTLVKHITEQLARHGIDGKRLVVQLPESKVSTHLRAAQGFQADVAKLGVRVGLEQFGSGLNPFQLLNHFDAAMIKLDRAFMEDLGSNPDNQAKIREIAENARTSGKQTIAEFVQDAASMSILFGAGIDYAQGHFLAPASPEMDYEF